MSYDDINMLGEKNKPPSTIYLQWLDEEDEKVSEATWCEDEIEENDIKYVLFDDFLALLDGCQQALGAVNLDNREILSTVAISVLDSAVKDYTARYLAAPAGCRCWDDS